MPRGASVSWQAGGNRPSGGGQCPSMGWYLTLQYLPSESGRLGSINGQMQRFKGSELLSLNPQDLLMGPVLFGVTVSPAVRT